jgi:dTDP-4-dehydrorhamnose 3,5-epimerase
VRFTETSVRGVILVEPELKTDERGFFARTWCREEFAAQGLSVALDQCSLSYNRLAGTLRGLHWQAAPHGEVKLVRCGRGAIYDVAVDLRPTSPTYRRWTGVELTERNHRLLYIPEGVAHGFLTLTDDTDVAYQIGGALHGDAARGARWDDPALAITWPRDVVVISPRDAAYPDLAV